MKVTKKSYAGLLVKSLLLGTLAIAVSINPLVLNEAVADPLDKSSPKIAHGMYRDRGKSSPKIAHGMYRDLDKSSPKIAHGMDKGLSDGIYILNFEAAIFLALEMGEFEIADALLEDLVELNAPIWEGGGGFNMRR